ncbi:MAG: mechanosensitive ion channel domain-containing protein [Planctomycetota bacterium]
MTVPVHRVWLTLAALIFAGPVAAQATQPLKPTQTEAERVQQRLYQVEASAEAVEQILAIGLTNDEAGRLLREARARLPRPAELAAAVAERERKLAEAKLELVALLERRRVAEVGEWVRLQQTVKQQEAAVQGLEELLALEEKLAVKASVLATRLDEELLFIGSASPLNAAWLRDVGTGTRWLTEPERWAAVGQAAWERLKRSPVQVVLGVLLVAGLFGVQRWTVRQEAALAALAGRFATDSFGLTLRAMLLMLLRVLPWPTLLVGLGALLLGASDPSPRAIAQGFIAAGVVWFILGLFRRVCADGGLADIYFNWDLHARRTLAANLAWLTPIEVPMAFVGATMKPLSNPAYFDGLGRLAFMVGTLAFVVFVARVFRPGQGVLASVLDREGWAWRLRRLWYVLLVAIPAGLSLAAAVGFFYTAVAVQDRFVVSGIVVLIGVIAYSLLARWLFVAQRRALVQQARQRLAEQRETREHSETQRDAEPASGEAVPELDEERLDVDAASKQTRTLLRIGVTISVLGMLWAVWAQLLPALAVLERVQLTSPTLADDGSVIVPAVTLWSLFLAGVVGALTVIATRNLPAVLELAVLQRFPIDAGTRYAIVMLLRYGVIAIGVVWVTQLVGIDWGKAQWIVAALGVGLGFGLQEIVANFVSGLIILFERPVRVGDVVTVGDVSGTVSKLQIRATTITDFDNKETLVPNKAFITDRVINWTLSNSTTRLLMTVGIAYGSDVAKAHTAITDAVHSVPTVLETPNPTVFFTGFGDSSLDFEVRAFVGQNPHRLPTLHALHLAIDAALREADIEIPFPQRDLHLRSSDLASPPFTTLDIEGNAPDR